MSSVCGSDDGVADDAMSRTIAAKDRNHRRVNAMCDTEATAAGPNSRDRRQAQNNSASHRLDSRLLSEYKLSKELIAHTIRYALE